MPWPLTSTVFPQADLQACMHGSRAGHPSRLSAICMGMNLQDLPKRLAGTRVRHAPTTTADSVGQTEHRWIKCRTPQCICCDTSLLAA